MFDKKAYIRKKIREIPNNAKIILYRNPKEFSYYNLEKINPTHIIHIWGKLKKKYRRSKNKYISVGKIIIPCIFLSFIQLDLLIEILPSAIMSFIFLDLYLILTKQDEIIKDLYKYKKRNQIILNYE